MHTRKCYSPSKGSLHNCLHPSVGHREVQFSATCHSQTSDLCHKEKIPRHKEMSRKQVCRQKGETEQRKQTTADPVEIRSLRSFNDFLDIDALTESSKKDAGGQRYQKQQIYQGGQVHPPRHGHQHGSCHCIASREPAAGTECATLRRKR